MALVNDIVRRYGGHSPMDPATAAWIRACVWPPVLRRIYQHNPVAAHTCACQWGATSACRNGIHEQCRPGALPIAETCLTFANDQVAQLPGAGGIEAQVWLADRTCAWRCCCRCHAAPEPEQSHLF